MQKSNSASIECAVERQNHNVNHCDRYHFDKTDFWRDIFPGKLGDIPKGQAVGTTCIENFSAGAVLSKFTSSKVYIISTQLFKPQVNGTPVELQAGRYYPRSFIAEAIQGFSEDNRPFRVTTIDDEYFTADLNHPLAKYSMTISAKVKEFTGAKEERGGRCNDILEMLCNNGPGT